MAEYIDREALRKRMFSYYDCVKEDACKWNYSGDTLMDYEVADLISDCLDNAPVVDVEEVVRCKDCRFKFLNNGHDKKGCPIISSGWAVWDVEEDNFFCAYGERKEKINDDGCL